MSEEDERLARLLQEEFYAELLANEDAVNDEVSSLLPTASQIKQKGRESQSSQSSLSVVSQEWEDLDPTPDLHSLFIGFNDEFFWGRLSCCEVKWSPRMTLCAGVCSYQRRSGYCSIRLSVPLLKLRPRKDLVETLLHEMIHAYLFVTDGNDDHDGHGPAFHEHMFRINKKTGAKISVYHNFHDEVDAYRTHWWQCDGPCRSRRPFYGLVKRAMNRAPGPNDRWWGDHERSCGGTYTKIKEPENYGKKKKGKTSATNENKPPPKIKGQGDIRSLFNKVPKTSPPSAASTSGKQPSYNPQSEAKKPKIFGFGETSYGLPSGSQGNVKTASKKTSSPSAASTSGKKPSINPQSEAKKPKIFGFGGTSYGLPSGSQGNVKTASKKTGTMVVNPGWKAKDNSSQGHVINKSNDPGSTKSSGSSTGSSSGTSSGAPSGSVQDQLRRVWTDRFGSGHNSSINKPTSSKIFEPKQTESKPKPSESQPKDDHVPCPICSCKVSPTVINQHLDQCLTEDKPFKQPTNDTQSCPICNKDIHKGEMNAHLDYCTGSK